jgi:hypothetical protein
MLQKIQPIQKNVTNIPKQCLVPEYTDIKKQIELQHNTVYKNLQRNGSPLLADEFKQSRHKQDQCMHDCILLAPKNRGSSNSKSK